jgi:hypothetical protein
MNSILKLTYILFISLLSYSGYAQTIPNHSFDIWSTDGPYEIADHWSSSNQFTYQINNTISLLSTSDSYEGALAANLHTTLIGFAAQPYMGWLVLGTPGIDPLTGDVDFKSAGVPFVSSPETLSAYYKFSNAQYPDDEAEVVIYLKAIDNLTGQSEVIAQGSSSLPVTSTYTQFSVALNYLNSNISPDSLIIAFKSSNSDPLIGGGSLIVDNLQFTSQNNADQLKTNGFKIYPNPSQNKVTIEFPEYEGVLKINIYNMLGSLVKLNRALSPSQTSSIDVNDLDEGYYLVEIKQEQEVLHTAKIIISRN